MGLLRRNKDAHVILVSSSISFPNNDSQQTGPTSHRFNQSETIPGILVIFSWLQLPSNSHGSVSWVELSRVEWSVVERRPKGCVCLEKLRACRSLASSTAMEWDLWVRESGGAGPPIMVHQAGSVTEGPLHCGDSWDLTWLQITTITTSPTAEVFAPAFWISNF